MRGYSLVLVALGMCAGAARAQKVKVDWDRATDFSPYKTYKWTKIHTPRTPTQEMEKLIQNSTDVQLAARGLKKVENSEADRLRRLLDHARPAEEAGLHGAHQRWLLVADWGFLERSIPLGSSNTERHTQHRYCRHQEKSAYLAGFRHG